MLLSGCEQILQQKDPNLLSPGFFEELVARLRANWSNRTTDRWPSQANWQLRIAPSVTLESNTRFEKQLEKAIASSMSAEGWGNAVATASGLVNSRLRQMNIDLAYRKPKGFGFIELKWTADNPVRAALQALQYAAIYMLYRLEPELIARFSGNEMLKATHLIFEVLAPRDYYASRHDLRALERTICDELQSFCANHLPSIDSEFRYTSFPKSFVFSPGMSGDLVRAAVLQRTSPFQDLSIRGSDGATVETLEEWRIHGLPPTRAGHWKPGRSACELGRFWVDYGRGGTPAEIDAILRSHTDTRGVTLHSGFIEHETALPFSIAGPRCHDLFLLGNCSNKSPIVLSIEAKADESFGATVGENLLKVMEKKSNFPARLEWLVQCFFGESAFIDFQKKILKPYYAKMPYQLFAGIGSVCLEAERHSAQRAILIVHEFRTDLTEDRKIDMNAKALDDFLNHLWARNSDLHVAASFGVLEGPLTVKPGSFGGVPFPGGINLYIGKLRTDIRTSVAANGPSL